MRRVHMSVSQTSESGLPAADSRRVERVALMLCLLASNAHTFRASSQLLFSPLQGRTYQFLLVIFCETCKQSNFSAEIFVGFCVNFLPTL